ncbi:unnamed protein product [Rotaria sp. Silwood2]|nr:unnamed protein product [Rotaria sp. Silwood2]CAF2817484.1 unnamed protein product [Rotaria sp. Silwood2]CAF4004717.1 unnamed protein product [Rotaria sp. Silwood2]CAF4025595.1 unnamed protein product [Rotaria sp. Silwood2]
MLSWLTKRHNRLSFLLHHLFKKMHLFNKLRTSFRRKSNKSELTISQQIEKLFNESNRLLVVNDHRLQLLRLVYEYRLREFNTLNISFNDIKRIEFEQSMLRSLLAITSNLPTSKSQSTFQRSSCFYRTMPIATSINILKENN